MHKNDVPWPQIVLVGIMLIIAFVSPLLTMYEYHIDEGWGLLSAGLIRDGYRLYTQIWYDQPPLYPVMLERWMALFGDSAASGRLLTLLFSCVLVLGFYGTVRLEYGKAVAFLCSLALILSYSFMFLGVAAMMGIPALALAIVAVYSLRRYQSSRRPVWLCFCGIWLALSLETKFFTALLVPAILLELVLSERGKHRITKPLLWLGSLCAAYLAVTALFFPWGNGELYWQMLFKTHLSGVPAPPNCTKIKLMHSMAGNDFDLVLLALAGTVSLVRKKLPLSLSWLVLAYAVLFFFRPLWFHYYVLLSIPLVWLTAPAFDAIRRQVKREKWRALRSPGFIFLAAAGLCFAAMLPYKALRSVKSLNQSGGQNREAVAAVEKSKNGWFYTDQPSVAFYARARIPPEIAVASMKRDYAAPKSQAEFIAVLERYKPSCLLLGSLFDRSRAIQAYVEEHYVFAGSIPFMEALDLPGPAIIFIWGYDYTGRNAGNGIKRRIINPKVVFLDRTYERKKTLLMKLYIIRKER